MEAQEFSQSRLGFSPLPSVGKPRVRATSPEPASAEAQEFPESSLGFSPLPRLVIPVSVRLHQPASTEVREFPKSANFPVEMPPLLGPVDNSNN